MTIRFVHSADFCENVARHRQLPGWPVAAEYVCSRAEAPAEVLVAKERFPAVATWRVMSECQAGMKGCGLGWYYKRPRARVGWEKHPSKLVEKDAKAKMRRVMEMVYRRLALLPPGMEGGSEED